MRNRRIFRILASSAAGLVLLPFSGWAAHTLFTPPGTAPAEAGVLTAAARFRTPNSIDQVRLEAEAHRAAMEAAAPHSADGPATDPHPDRQRASRSAFRSAPAVPPPPPADGDDVWARLRRCEAGGNYSRNSGNGYYGTYQFSAETWHALGYPGLPHQAPPEVQDEAARKLQRRSGWGQWPACSRRIGAR